MKRSIIILAAILFTTVLSNAQMTFSVNPGLGLNGASFGYQIGDFVPMIGLNYLSASTSVESNYMDYNDSLDIYFPTVSKEDLSFDIIMPYIGLKYFITKDKKIKSYAAGKFYKPIISAEIKDNLTPSINDDLDDINNIDLFAVELGVGAEYYLDDNFSLGGEFGLRYISGTSEYEIDDYYYQNGDQVDYVRKYDLTGFLGATYANISFNYYFGN